MAYLSVCLCIVWLTSAAYGDWLPSGAGDEANVLFVDASSANATNSSSCGTQQAPCATINQAIMNNATVVCVAAGNYSGSGNIPVSVRSSITLLGNNTMLDCSSVKHSSCMDLLLAAEHAVEISGFIFSSFPDNVPYPVVSAKSTSILSTCNSSLLLDHVSFQNNGGDYAFRFGGSMVLSEGVQLYIRNAEFAFNSGKLLEASVCNVQVHNTSMHNNVIRSDGFLLSLGNEATNSQQFRANATLHNVSVTQNIAYGGGIIEALPSTMVSLHTCTFKKNQGATAIFESAARDTAVVQSDFSENLAPHGVIHITTSQSTFSLQSSNVWHNLCSAVRASSNVVIVENSKFSGNEDFHLFLDSVDVGVVRECDFSGMRTAQSPVVVDSRFDASNITFQKCSGSGNIAYNGGVMSVFGPIKKLLLDVQIIDCDFQNNHAEVAGGALFVTGGVLMTVSGGDFSNNKAYLGGGVFCSSLGSDDDGGVGEGEDVYRRSTSDSGNCEQTDECPGGRGPPTVQFIGSETKINSNAIEGKEFLSFPYDCTCCLSCSSDNQAVCISEGESSPPVDWIALSVVTSSILLTMIGALGIAVGSYFCLKNRMGKQVPVDISIEY